MKRFGVFCVLLAAVAFLMTGPIPDAWAQCAGCGQADQAEVKCPKNSSRPCCATKCDQATKCEKAKSSDQTCAVCLKCGELKCSEKCCKADGRKKCQKCGLYKKSLACCKVPEGRKPEDAKLCMKCGEFAGTEECCKTEGRKQCKKCGLLKGSPGCCRLPNDCQKKCSPKRGCPAAVKRPCCM